MSRYGSGHEDLKNLRNAARAARADIQELNAKEIMAADSAEVLGSKLDAAAVSNRELAAARREAADAAAREARVSGQVATGLRAEADAIERNTAARARRATVVRQENVELSRALRGARDPLFARAGDISATGGGVRQFRQQLGVGYSRARALQDALSSGFQPAGLSATPQGPIDRVSGAYLAKAAIDNQIQSANKALRGNLSDQDRAVALRAKDLAKEQLTQAEREIVAAKEAADATAQRATAERELARRRAVEAARAPGSDIITHPSLFGKQAYAPIGSPLGTARQPMIEGGAVGGRYGGGVPGYDEGRDAQKAARAHVLRAQAINDEITALKGLTYADQQALRAMHPEVRDGVIQQYQKSVRATDQLTAASGRITNATRSAAVAYGTESQALRRRGALTSEFIAAAARGETTMREIGYQTVVTAAKFGGWTLAATALYGAANAMRQVGRGAIDASSGVYQLRRVVNDVNSDQVQRKFGDLAQQFNVPIGTASDAVYRMGQVFHDQASAVEAAKASLYSFKTGEVDVATSTQNLIAITRGFGLSSSDLLNVYDQINQAQNTFGIKIGDTEAGLAKAAGTYRNAGGDLNYLLGLFVAIQKATGRSGQEIGTGLARGVSQIRRPTNQQVLRGLGVEVDPNNFQTTVQSALKAAQRGADPNRLASGLLGNQYARLLAPVLADQSTLNKALKDTSPEASKGSAQKELAKVLKQVDEQIKAIGVNLQTFGEALSRAGAFNAFGGLLKIINLLVEKTTDLVNLFNKIVPPDIRPFVTGAIQAAAAIALIRRTGGPSGAIAERLPFLANPDRRLQILATRGMRDQLSSVTDTIESMSRRAQQLATEAEGARNASQAFATGYQGAARAGTLPLLGTDARGRIETQRTDLANKALRAETKAAQFQDQISGMRQVQLRAEQELATIQQLEATKVRAYLAANNIPIPAELQTPSSKGIVRVTQAGSVVQEAGAVAVGGAVAGAQTERAVAELALGSDAAAQQIERLRETIDFTDLRDKAIEPFKEASAAMKEAGASARVLSVSEKEWAAAGAVPGRTPPIPGFGESGSPQLQLPGMGGIPEGGFVGPSPFGGGKGPSALQGRVKAFGDGMLSRLGEMGHVGGALEDVARRGGGLADRASTRLRGSFGRIRSMGTSLASMTRNFVAGFGLLDGAVAAFVAYSYIKPKIDAANAKHQALMKTIQGPTYSESQRQAQLDAINQGIKDKNKGESVGDFLGDVVRNVGSVAGGIVTGKFGQGDFSGVHTRVGERQKAGYASLAEQARLQAEAAEVARQAAEGGPVSNRFPDENRKAVKQNVDDAIAGMTTLAQFKKEIQDRLAEVTHSAHVNKPGVAKLQGETLAAYRQSLAKLDPSDFSARFDSASPDDLRSQVGITAARMGQVGRRSKRFDFSELDAAYRRLYDQLSGSGDYKDMAQLAQDRDAFFQAYESDAQRETQELLATANTEGKRRAAFARGRQILRRAPVEARNALVKARGEARAAQSQVESDRMSQQTFGAVGGFSGGLATPFGAGSIAPVVGGANRTAGQLLLSRAALSKKLRDDMKLLRQAEGTLSKAVGKYRDSVQRDEVLLAQDTDAQYQDRATGRQTALALRQSRTTDPGTQAAEAAKSASGQMADALKTYHSKQSRAYMDAETAYNLAIQQGADAMRAEAQQIQQLVGQIAVARAGGDAVAAARAMQGVAAQEKSSARTRVERLQATLDQVNADNQLQDALRARTQANYDLLSSKTTDPVEQARLARDAARKAVHGTKGTAHTQALAESNRADRAYLDSKLQSREDDIQFSLDMEKITTSTAIAQYKALLSIHNLTKAQRRDIKRQIHQLEKDSQADFGDLDIAKIKLPTAYEVRRAVKGVAQGLNVTNHYATTVNVSRDVDISKVAATFDRHVRGTGRSIDRAAQLR